MITRAKLNVSEKRENMKQIPTLLCDFYKLSHRNLYPENTQLIYSTWTPRTSRVTGVNEVVVFGQQMAVQKLHDVFQTDFFDRPKEEVLTEYKEFITGTLGDPNPEVDHLADLHDLGYLPLEVKTLDEGSVVQVRTPTLTIQNTNPKFFWLTNFVETILSCELWAPATSATLAREYFKILTKYSKETTGSADFVPFQGHDFSMRGMSSLQSAMSSGLGHLAAGFVGTDTCPAIYAAKHYYGDDYRKALIGTSVPATEHSVQCSYGDDVKYFERIITEVHPNGIVSIVSDGYDFWDVIGRVVPALKDKIMARKGGAIVDKVVIRPDSGDPVLILCGDPSAPVGSLEYKGAVEALWDVFGGTTTDQGYRCLDSHIGLIYGDAITLRRCEEILSLLKAKGFASTNVVFGIGSFTYQYNTRDTFGYALKSTLAVINGDEKAIFKNPKTDDGTKKSQKGKVMVFKDIGGIIKFTDGHKLDDEMSNNLLTTLYKNGTMVKKQSLTEIRKKLQE